MGFSIRDAMSEFGPPWMNAEVTGTIKRSFTSVIDALGDRVEQGVKLRFPNEDCPSALGYIGNDRQIERGPYQTHAGYAAQLRKAFDTWQNAGHPETLLTQLQAYFAGQDCPPMRLVSERPYAGMGQVPGLSVTGTGPGYAGGDTGGGGTEDLPPTYGLDVDFTTFAPGFYDAAAFQAAMDGAYPDFSLVRCYTPEAHGGPPITGIGDGLGGGYSARRADQGETVQVSPTALLRSALDTQADVACVGNKTTLTGKRGLLVMAPYCNKFLPVGGTYQDGNPNMSCMRATGNYGAWSLLASNSVETYPYADSPDGSGTGSTHVVTTAAPGYSSPRHDMTGTELGMFAECIMHWWKKGAEYGRWHYNLFGSDLVAPILFQDVDAVAWKRMVVPHPAYPSGSPPYAPTHFHPAYSPTGLPSVDVLVCYFMLERGLVAREMIPTIGDTRPGDRPVYATGSDLIASNGQIRVYTRLSPYHASTDAIVWDLTSGATGNVTNYYLFSWGASGTTATSYAFVKASDRKLYVKIEGGTEYASTNTIDFAADDEIEIYIAVGNGAASIAKWRVVSDVDGVETGDGWTDFDLATVPDVPAPGATPIAFLHNLAPTASTSDTGQWTARIHKLSAFVTGAPAGI